VCLMGPGAMSAYVDMWPVRFIFNLWLQGILCLELGGTTQV